ncbi:MAG: terminase, partial [Ruminiclostridium sp.]
MELTNQDMELFDKIMKDGNECDFIETFIEIVDKNLKLVPFFLTHEQRIFIDTLEKYNIVLKSRQLGLSVATVALAIRQCIVHENSCCLLVSHDQKSCNAIFDKLKQQFKSVPEWLKPEEIANNRQEIKMSNGSKVTVVCAGTKAIGRGDTLHLVHCSEFAFWKSSKNQLNSIMQALAPDGKIIIESTANGQNFFAETFFKAQRNENSFKSFFFNWVKGRTLFEKDYQNAVDIWLLRNNNKMLTMEDLDEDELELVKLGADIKQIVWRRLKVSNSSLEEFKQEYPATPTEAFQTTGSQIFSNKRIDEVSHAISN